SALPEPMRPRLFDHRMGFASEGSFSSPNWEMKTGMGSIRRWKLEKEDDKIILSNPIKPIVFYLDPRIPNKWKPYVRAGIEEWLPAFEEAGFLNAIEVKDVPSDADAEFFISIANSIIFWKDTVEIRGKSGGGSNC